jgi:hypothetical protein
MAAGDPGTRKRNYSATAVQTTLNGSMSAASTGDVSASVSVLSVSGFPGTFPYTLIIAPDTSKEEVVTVTGGTGTTLNMVRGQDGTTAVSHAAGVSVRHGVSAREFKELQTHISARGVDTDTALLNGVDTHIHGIALGDGDVVGTAKVQTLSNKTFTGSFTASAATFVSPTITTPTISGGSISGLTALTGLVSSGLTLTSATPKSYVDAKVASVTGFNGVYLGAYASAPTTDNAGGTLVVGTLYFDTVAVLMKVWSGSSWGNIVTPAQLFRYKFIATTGQTSVSGTDLNGLTMSYVIGSELFYLNGVLLLRGTDYTATNGTTITGISPMLAGDTIEIMVFSQFTVTSGLTTASFTAKGDMVVGTGPGTINTLIVGADGYYLKADSTTTTGLRWAPVTPYALPSQIGKTGQFLTTNGTIESWSSFTLGSTIITTTAATTTIIGLTKLQSVAYTQLDADSKELDISLMCLMGAY